MRVDRRRFRVSMKLGLALAVTLGLGIWAAAQGNAPQGSAPAAAPQQGFEMQVPSFPDGGDFPVKYSEFGDKVSPAITWTNPPKGTVTFVLNFHDQNNARNKTTDDMLDWMVWNIPASATGLPENVPPGNQLANGAVQTSASGPGTYRPPGFSGGATGTGAKHHYVFDLYAIDMKVDVPVTGEPFETRQEVFKAIQGHVLGKAVYMGLFRQPTRPPGTPAPPPRPQV